MRSGLLRRGTLLVCVTLSDGFGVKQADDLPGGMVYPVLVRELLPKIGFAWTTRVLGFLNFGLLAIAFTFMRPRLPPRSTGPIVDWKAFTEPVFVLFVAGIFFVLWNVYFTFYYVSLVENVVCVKGAKC